MCLEAHLVDDRGVRLPLLDFVPNDPIHDVSAKLIHSEYLVGAEHLLVVHLFVLVLVARFLRQLAVVSVHFNLHEDELIIVLKELCSLVHLFLGDVRA